VSLSSVEAIISIFTNLIDDNFFDWLLKVRSRSLVGPDGYDPAPIITDLEKMKRMLARLFEVRHILVHEFPVTAIFDTTEIDEMLDAASAFIGAADEGFTQLLYGHYPLSQQAMNRAARDECEAVNTELEKKVGEVATVSGSNTIHDVQRAWRAFAEAEAHRSAEGFTGGNMYPLIYSSALKGLSADRLRQVREWLEEQQE
jgi:uncharacterized protein YecT (DUF1311 family)